MFITIGKAIRNLLFTYIALVSNVPLALLYIWKISVTYLVSVFKKDLLPLKALDYLVGICLDIDIEDTKSKDYNGNIGITCKLNGKVDSEQLFETFVKNVINIDPNKPFDPNHKHVRFHQSVSRFCGYWFFKTFPKLTYQDHVTCTTLPNNSTYEEVICEWLKIRYDTKKCPLWGILLIYREESHDTIFAFKIHHILADGYSLLHILDLLTNTNYKYQVKDFNDSKWEKLKIITESAYNIFKHNLKIAFSVGQSPFCRKKDDADNNIFMTHFSVPVSVIKDIRKKANVRFQSVMLHLILNYVNSIIFDTTEEKDIPEKIIITNSLPWPKHSRNELCNHATGATFTFRIKDKDKKTRYKESLTDINTTFEDFYSQHLDRAVLLLSKPLAVIPLNFVDFKYAQNRLNGKLTGFYVHLVGSDEYTKVLDYECRDVNIFCIPPKQRGITINCLTTSNEVRFCVMGPKSTFPTQDNANNFIQENINYHITDLVGTGHGLCSENTSHL